MTCPNEIRSQLLTILQIGIRSIISCCEIKQYERCHVEATHIHNLPDLIEDFSPQKLRYYLEVEMPEYLQDSGGRAVNELQAAWEVLKRWQAQFRGHS